MEFIIKCIRITLAFFTTLFMGLAVSWTFLLKKETRIKIVQGYLNIPKHWGYSIKKILGLDWKIQNKSAIPHKKKNYLSVSNHLSALDIILLSDVLEVPYLIKKSLVYHPVGLGAMASGSVALNRGSVKERFKSIKRVIEIAKKEYPIHVFPEGTRSVDGSLLPINKNLFILAYRENVSVLASGIWGTQHLFPKNSLLARNKASPTITIGPMLEPKNFEDSKAFAEAIVQSILKNVKNSKKVYENTHPRLKSNIQIELADSQPVDLMSHKSAKFITQQTSSKGWSPAANFSPTKKYNTLKETLLKLNKKSQQFISTLPGQFEQIKQKVSTLPDKISVQESIKITDTKNTGSIKNKAPNKTNLKGNKTPNKPANAAKTIAEKSVYLPPLTNLFYHQFNSELGPLHILADNENLIKISYHLPLELNDITKNIKHASNEIITEAEKQIKNFLAGSRKSFDLKYKLYGSTFYIKIWKKLAEVPYATTISYKQLGQNFSPHLSPRLIGSAMSQNPLPIILPCHRVIGSNKKLTGYRGGINNKKLLLDLEAKYKK